MILFKILDLSLTVRARKGGKRKCVLCICSTWQKFRSYTLYMQYMVEIRCYTLYYMQYMVEMFMVHINEQIIFLSSIFPTHLAKVFNHNSVTIRTANLNVTLPRSSAVNNQSAIFYMLKFKEISYNRLRQFPII